MKLILAVLILLVACGPTSKRLAHAELANAVDCGTPKAKALADEYGPAFKTVLQNATTDAGDIDVPTFESATKSLTDIGWCVVEKTISQALTAALPMLGAPQSEATRASNEKLRATVLELRERYHPGKVFVEHDVPLVGAQ